MALGYITLVVVTIGCATKAAAAHLVYPDAVTPTFGDVDEASARKGIKQCEIDITLVKLPQGVDFRVKLLSDGKATFPTLTFDVGEWTMSNGIPYDPRRVSIKSAGISSNVFMTTPQMKWIDMKDGGLGLSLSLEEFKTVLALVARGDYLISFTPKGAKEETVYAVRSGVDQKVLGQFQTCLKRM
jgi:hypothetical protein